MSWGFQNTLFFSSFFYPSDKWAFSQISLPKCHLAKAKSKNISSVWKQGSMIFPSSLSTLYDFLFTTLHLDVKSSESKRKLILQVEKSFFCKKKRKKKFAFFSSFSMFYYYAFANSHLYRSSKHFFSLSLPCNSIQKIFIFMKTLSEKCAFIWQIGS